MIVISVSSLILQFVTSNGNIMRNNDYKDFCGELCQRGLRLQTAVQSPKSGMSNVVLLVAGRCWAGAGSCRRILRKK